MKKIIAVVCAIQLAVISAGATYLAKDYHDRAVAPFSHKKAEFFTIDNRAQTPCLLVNYKGFGYIHCYVDESLKSLGEKMK